MWLIKVKATSQPNPESSNKRYDDKALSRSVCQELKLLSNYRHLNILDIMRLHTPLTYAQSITAVTTSLMTIAIYMTPILSIHGHAQVNVEQNRPQTRDGFHSTLDSAFTLIRGNVDLSQLSLNGRAEYARGVHTPFVQASISYGEKSGVAFLNQSFGHARWTAMWLDFVGTEVFAQLQENSFRSLVLRQLYGGGVRVRFSAWRSGHFAMGLGSMFEREVYVERNEMSTREVLENNARATSYLTLRQEVKSATDINLSSTLYFQPLLAQVHDYRILYDVSCEIKLSALIRLVESFHLLYDTEPPPSVKGYDLKSMTSLRLSF